MDLLDTNNTGSFPPNVTLSPMNNSYPTQITTVMNNNSMMMYSPQPPPAHMQHHQTPPPNTLYRQSSQQQPPPMYSNYVQQPTNPPYYSMPVSNQAQQRMTPGQHHANQLAKRQTFIQQQQRTSAQMNQQLQLHMSMNVTLPHVNLILFDPENVISILFRWGKTSNNSNYHQCHIDVGFHSTPSFLLE